jgi:uncharacterized protein YdaU (DUF1376 family)
MSGPVDLFMPWYIGDYLRDTTHLTTEQNGAYCMLLMGAWVREGKLPDDDEQLMGICKLTPEKWEKSKVVLQKFFKVVNGEWIQKRLMQEYQRALVLQKTNSRKARHAAMARHHPKKEPEPEPEPDPMNPWSVGRLLLKQRNDMSFKQASAFIGKLIKDHGEPAVLAAFKAAQEKQPPPADMKSYVLGILKQSKKTEGFFNDLNARTTA